MARRCESCNSTVPAWQPRKRNERTGAKECSACASEPHVEVDDLGADMVHAMLRSNGVDVDMDLARRVASIPRPGPDDPRLTTTSARKVASVDGDFARFLDTIEDGLGDRWMLDMVAGEFWHYVETHFDPATVERIVEADEVRNRMLYGASLQTVAHDAGDGETINHCPFCGSGNVVARSDGSAECGHCDAVFTCQVQPQHPYTPQTVNGQPYDNPDLPGQVTVPGEGEGAPGAPPEDNGSLVFQPDDGLVFDPSVGQVAASKTALKWTSKPTGDQTLASSEAPYHAGVRPLGRKGADGWAWKVAYQDYATMDSSEPVADGKESTIGAAKAAVEKAIREHKASIKTSSRKTATYVTAQKVDLPEESYLRHLALHHADDPGIVLERVRAENGL